MTRYEELASKFDNVDKSKKPFILALVKDFVKWEEIEQDLLKTTLFKVRKYKDEFIVDELPSFKMLNTATARKEDAIKSIVKLLEGEVKEDSPLMKALASFNEKHTGKTPVEYR